MPFTVLREGANAEKSTVMICRAVHAAAGNLGAGGFHRPAQTLTAQRDLSIYGPSSPVKHRVNHKLGVGFK